MLTYADQMAARNPRNGHTGPVRLWISSGEMIRDPDGRMVLSERWEEEEIMDTDVISTLDDDNATLVPSYRGPSLARLLHDNLQRTATAANQTPRGGSLLVLDTNTLLSALPACMAIFTQCLARNVFALESGSFSSSPIMLIVPYVVVRELDGLKSNGRRDRIDHDMTVGQKAQRANRWILDAIQQQKKRSYNEHGISVSIPEQAWVLHVESSAFYQTSCRDPMYRMDTPDDEIISHCRSLQRDTHQSVWLCSDDVNAKLRAESDSVPTFSIADWVQDVVGHVSGDRDERLTYAISDLIDQWNDQMGGSTNGDDATADGAAILMEQDPPPPYETHGVRDSAHAPSRQDLDTNRRTTYRTGTRIAGNRIPNRQHHASSADRSSASSMWASR